MNTFITNGNDSLNFLVNDIEAQTKKIKEEIKKIDEMLSKEPESFSSRLEKIEYKTKMFELISKKKALAFNLSFITTHLNKK